MAAELKRLQEAVATANINEAIRLTTQLCQKKASLHVYPVFNKTDVRVKVVFEDKKKVYGHVYMKLSPLVPIEELKEKIFQEHQIPPELQCWVIRNRIAQNGETLAQCGIGDGADDGVINLYVVSARLSGKTAPEILAKYYGGAGAGAAPVNKEVRKKEVHVRGEGDGCKTQASPEVKPPQVSPQILLGATARPAPPRAAPVPKPRPKPAPPRKGWTCPKCTFINVPTRPGCELCSEGRPEEYVVPADAEITIAERQRMNQEAIFDQLTERQRRQDEAEREKERQKNLAELIAADDNAIVANTEEFECPICYVDIDVGEGVILRECLHPVCLDCLRGHIQHSEDMPVSCPYRESDNPCEGIVQHREVQQVVPPELFERYLARSLTKGVAKLTNTYQCKTPDCIGVYELVDDINQFNCQVCKHQNCVACNAIHDDMNCQEYQDDLKRKEANDEAARQTKAALEAMVTNGEAMNCPKCGVILQKRSGCDWMKCSMCATEICWATKGPRWGPGGRGDTSGGCGCQLRTKPCTPNCGNCH